jgi:hypothetical protein
MATLQSRAPGKYGRAALLAASLYRFGNVASLAEAWERAVVEVFPANISSQEKGCPKGAFLGLCQEGFVKGIGRGEYTNSQHNRGYAVRAVQLLRENPALSHDINLLWSSVLGGEEKVHNHQMDVVLSLWAEGLIESRDVQ